MKTILVVLCAGLALHAAQANETSARSGSDLLVLPTYVISAPRPGSLQVRLAVEADALRAEALRRPDLVDRPRSLQASAVKLADQQPDPRTTRNGSS